MSRKKVPVRQREAALANYRSTLATSIAHSSVRVVKLAFAVGFVLGAAAATGAITVCLYLGWL